MDNSGRVARFLQAWREDYIYQTLAGAAMLPLSAASSAVIYAVIVCITVQMLWNGLKEKKTPDGIPMTISHLR